MSRYFTVLFQKVIWYQRIFIDIASNTLSSNLENILLSSSRTLEPEMFFPLADDLPIVWELDGLEKINKHFNNSKIDKKDNKIGKY